MQVVYTIIYKLYKYYIIVEERSTFFCHTAKQTGSSIGRRFDDPFFQVLREAHIECVVRRTHRADRTGLHIESRKRYIDK